MRSSTASVFHLIELFKYKLLSSSSFPYLHILVVNLGSCYVLVIHITKLVSASVFLLTYQQVSNKTEDTEDITFDRTFIERDLEFAVAALELKKVKTQN